MHSRMTDAHFELELADMKNAHTYRIIAIDHDMFSFVDARLNEWPVIIVTTPKEAAYLSSYEPIGVVKRSSHIRVLVFSDEVVNKVTVRVDGEGEKEMVRVSGPLFVVEWEAGMYEEGMHSMVVVATDEGGRTATSEITVRNLK